MAPLRLAMHGGTPGSPLGPLLAGGVVPRSFQEPPGLVALRGFPCLFASRRAKPGSGGACWRSPPAVRASKLPRGSDDFPEHVKAEDEGEGEADDCDRVVHPGH